MEYFCPECKGKPTSKLMDLDIRKYPVRCLYISFLCVFHKFLYYKHYLLFGKLTYLCLSMLISTSSAEKLGSKTPPDKLTVVCNGMEGIYFPSLHL